MQKIFVSAIVVLLLSGCSVQTFNINAGGSTEPNKEEMQAFFFSGIGQMKEMNATKICGSAENIAKVEVEETFLDGLIALLTLGIYTPRDARVYCKK